MYIWFGNLTQHTVLLLGTDDLWEHSHEVVVDGVALLGLGFLFGGKGVVSTVQGPYMSSIGIVPAEKSDKEWRETYRSIHARSQLLFENGASLVGVALGCPAA